MTPGHANLAAELPLLGAEAGATPLPAGVGPARSIAGLAVLAALGALTFGWLRSSRATTGDTLLLEVVGQRFAWQVRYAGADGELHTADDRQTIGAPHFPADTTVILRLTSADYLYSFRVRELGVNEVALPGEVYEQRFRTGARGELELQGDQFCGYRHDELRGTIRVDSAPEFAAYLEHLAPAQP